MLEALDAAIVELTPEDQLKEEIGRVGEYSEKIQRTLLMIRKALKACLLQTVLRVIFLFEILLMTLTPFLIHHQTQM